MCIDYELDIQAEAFFDQLAVMPGYLPVHWTAGSIGSAATKPHVRIADKAIVLSLQDEQLMADLLPWGWEHRGHRLFKLDAGTRTFADSERCLILATGFYDYTAPFQPRGKWRDQHLVKLRGHKWFWIAGIIKHGSFAMLTKESHSLVRRFCRSQICIIPPWEGLAWLQLTVPASRLLRTTPKWLLETSTLRKNRDLKPLLHAPVGA